MTWWEIFIVYLGGWSLFIGTGITSALYLYRGEIMPENMLKKEMKDIFTRQTFWYSVVFVILYLVFGR